ncbi:MAG: CPBP family intramembrane metalloprotease [Acholeplasmataceae bacterium]|nr:CPBP family intramembrane metalloprotease [Acholeplasmataceae bacterium]
MMFLIASFVAVFLYSFDKTTYEYSSTDEIIIELQTEAAISFTTSEDLDKSFYGTKFIDTYPLKNSFFLITTKDLFPRDLEIDDEFVKTVFEEHKYTVDSFKIKRLAKKEDNSEFYNLYNIVTPQIEKEITGSFGLNELGEIINIVVVYILVFLGVFAFSFKMLKEEFQNLPKGILFTIGAIILGVLVVYFGNLISAIISQILSILFKEKIVTSLNQATIERQLTSQYGALIIIVVVLLGPIVEELVFRKAFFTLIKNQWVALVVSSLLFGLIHVVTEASIHSFLINLIPYLVSGIALGLIYIYNKKNIVVSMFTHILINLISVIIVFVSYSL